MQGRLGMMTALFLVATACETEERKPEDGQAATDPARSSPSASPGQSGEAGIASEDRADSGAGTTWTELYRDLFGPTAPASCAGTGICHGSAEDPGAQGSNGYVCATQDGCRTSMLSRETGLVQPLDFAAPANSTLVKTLRRRSASGSIVGSMPKRSSFVFSDDAIARIESWIQRGAPAD